MGIMSAENRRQTQRPKVERLRSLTKEAKQLRAKGQYLNADKLEPEIRSLKKDLGIKTEPKKSTTRAGNVGEFKKELLKRLERCKK